MKYDINKATVIGVVVIAALIRSILYSDAQASSSFKFLIGVATLVVAYALVDAIIEHTKSKQRREDHRIRALYHYYSEMLKLEQEDPRRLKNLREIDDLEEFMLAYKKYKEEKGNEENL